MHNFLNYNEETKILIELNASFKAIKPYCYCTVNSIYNNESIPIALIIGISETNELYELVYKYLVDFGIDEHKLNMIPVLSDMGSGLLLFCQNRNLKQFFCHRHILERFGHPVLRNWAKRIIECTTEDEYDTVVLQINEEIKIWYSQIDKSAMPPKIVDIQMMIDKFTDNRKYSVDKFALWKRINYHVCRCSNHSEALHRVFNAKNSKYRSFEKKLASMIKVIIKKFTLQENNHGRSIKNRYLKLKLCYEQEKGKNLQCNYSDNNCKCGWSQYYSSIYGVTFPCIHMMGCHEFEKCPSIPPLKSTNYESINH